MLHLTHQISQIDDAEIIEDKISISIARGRSNRLEVQRKIYYLWLACMIYENRNFKEILLSSCLRVGSILFLFYFWHTIKSL